VSPRPQKVSDDEVFAATHRVMSRVAPGDLTLALIAEEAGVTAGALVQRFGSKRELLLALANRFGGGARELMAALRAKNKTPLATIRAYAACMAQLAPSPDALARNLAYLQIDLLDPDFRKPLLQNAKATRSELESLMKEAKADGEIGNGADARLLARTLETTVSGALLTWAIHREGSAATWVSAEVESILRPYLTKAKPKRRTRSRPG
jgi:AcrR family transcriptional regulator